MDKMVNIQDQINELSEDWQEIILKNLNPSDINYINELYSTNEYKVFPPKENLFEAFKYFSLYKTKVIILGQDPYPSAGKAHGLAFSVPLGVKIPASLRNIFAELRHEYLELENSSQLKCGNLIRWAKQGVLLLNTTLTVKEGKPNSHAKFWKKITDGIIKDISQKLDGCVFLLWGNNAKLKASLIDDKKHYLFKCCHPSPLSANRGDWFYNSQFQLCNIYLELRNKGKIEWL
jgi:uracil-DNA glycosylase